MALNDEEGLRVTFHPPLYLQRQAWVLNILRRERVQSVLDIGCGEGSLLQCLTEPSYTLPPATSLPPTSSFVSGSTVEDQADLYLKVIHGLDPCAHDVEFAILSTAPPGPDNLPFNGYERWVRRGVRWMPLEVNIWEGGFETINDAFEGANIDAFVASEVIEHLTPELLPLFAPVLLGHYRPRLLLLTTPNFTYNQRFTRPGEVSSTGYLDPTGRTDRVFRHHDHKFEWTTEEWNKYCSDSAANFGYSVDIGGLGLAVEPDPWNRDGSLGYASQVAVFRRLDNKQSRADALDCLSSNISAPAQRLILRAKHIHQPHPLSPEELAIPSDAAEIREAVKEAMNYNRKDNLTFSELWKHGEISLKCRGDIGALVRALDAASLDRDVWLVKDEIKAWKTTVTWKRYVEMVDPPGLAESEVCGWSSDDIDVENEAASGSPLWGPLAAENDNSGNEAGVSDCSWGWASEGGQTHWGWGDTNEEACDTTTTPIERPGLVLLHP